MSPEEILHQGLMDLGAPCTPEILERFADYGAYLLAENQKMNLTAIESPADVARLHFLDSVAAAQGLALAGARVLDVGSGAGFPGVPLQICWPDMDLTLLDSQQKRVDFLTRLAGVLDLDFAAVHGRAEELAMDRAWREGFDLVFSRAVARLDVLTELCLPLVQVGGAFIALKGRDSDEEVAAAAAAIEKLGGAAAQVRDYVLPGTDTPRRVVRIEKRQPTPSGYPRRFAKIQKRPIGA